MPVLRSVMYKVMIVSAGCPRIQPRFMPINPKCLLLKYTREHLRVAKKEGREQRSANQK